MCNTFRGLASDFIPFEVPASIDFSPLRAFLEKSSFRWESHNEFSINTWAARGHAWKVWRSIIWGDILNPPVEKGPRTFFSKKQKGNSLQFPVTIPTRVSVSKGFRSHRFVSLLDPASIVGLATFQDEFGDSLLMATSRSTNSLRRPMRTRPRAFSVTPVDQRKHVSETRRVRAQKDLDRALRPFFVVGPFRYIGTFYASDEYRSLRRKYPILVCSDISSCFDSIYTHSIDWALNGILSGKNYDMRADLRGSFGSRLDKALQSVNYEETKGIPIGPEFSRTIAEIILQRVDLLINLRLSERGRISGRDYNFKRYVDDYFLFASSPTVADELIEAMDKSLSEYRLNRNVEKTRVYSDEEPDLRNEVKRFVGSEFGTLTSYRLTERHGGVFERIAAADVVWTRLREISSSLDIEMNEVSAYSLGVIRRHVERILHDVSMISSCTCQLCLEVRDRSEETAIEYISNVINVAFRLFESHPSESMALKLGAIILKIDTVAVEFQWPLSHYWPFRDDLELRMNKYLNSALAGPMRRYPVLLLLDSVSRVKGLNGAAVLEVLTNILHKPDLNCLELVVVSDLLFRWDSSDASRSKVVNRLKLYVGKPARECDRTGIKYLAMFFVDCPFLQPDEFCDIFRSLGLSASNVLRFRQAEDARGLFDWHESIPYLDRVKMKARPMPY